MIGAHYSGKATDSRFSILRHFTSVRAAGIFHCRLNDAATWTAEKRGNCTPVEIGQSIMRRKHDECIGKKKLPPARRALELAHSADSEMDKRTAANEVFHM